MPRLFFAGDMRLSVRYLMKEEKERFGKRLKAIFLGSKAKLLSPKQSVKFILSDIVRKY